MLGIGCTSFRDGKCCCNCRYRPSASNLARKNKCPHYTQARGTRQVLPPSAPPLPRNPVHTHTHTHTHTLIHDVSLYDACWYCVRLWLAQTHTRAYTHTHERTHMHTPTHSLCLSLYRSSTLFRSLPHIHTHTQQSETRKKQRQTNPELLARGHDSF